ncbi:aspartokinase [Christiangramia forsetii]|uniref:homoserine dehydrogenase n=2 Tax=Christiangramia forsetii TaxID=411153 RepID=A0LY59_CHRFK|nr:aspartokinase [Christiangramia forsetii]GGG34943.1 aspartokinase [Christiangramia forsetii]CAL65304.1 homoserine dehydrogenase [Christiangramia forsetii KT0803]
MKTIHLALFGPGKVGSKLLEQLSISEEHLKKSSGINVKLILVADSSHALLNPKGIKSSWNNGFKSGAKRYSFNDIKDYFRENEFKNLVSIDTTASEDFPQKYIALVNAGSHIIAANKVANTLSSEFYKELRKELKRNNKKFIYETNVGAGLPIVETLRNLHLSGEKVTRIRGVFSGSLSYIFNKYSEDEKDFSEVLKEAGILGYTEPDARIDLSGKDVGRKLLILARELELNKELTDVRIQSLIPKQLNGDTSLEEFNKRVEELDLHFGSYKKDKSEDEVLRYVGELNAVSGELEAKLIKEPKTSVLGQIEGADNIFEIYTESYKDLPLVIRGAGAGADVTARGVFGDILKISERLN